MLSATTRVQGNWARGQSLPRRNAQTIVWFHSFPNFFVVVQPIKEAREGLGYPAAPTRHPHLYEVGKVCLDCLGEGAAFAARHRWYGLTECPE